jgi:hypothetical protein
MTYEILKLCMHMQFNDSVEMTEQTMAQKSNIPIKDLKHHVSSLVKAKILDQLEGTYTLNMQFTSKKTRISVCISLCVAFSYCS